MVPLLRSLLAADAGRRDRAADEVTDWLTSYGEAEATTLARVLAWATTLETDASAQEAQLNAISELVTVGGVPADVVASVGALDRAALRGSSVEHYDYLTSGEV
jgi:hypothetical protein